MITLNSRQYDETIDASARHGITLPHSYLGAHLLFTGACTCVTVRGESERRLEAMLRYARADSLILRDLHRSVSC